MDESSAIMDESSEHLFILEQSGSELKKIWHNGDTCVETTFFKKVHTGGSATQKPGYTGTLHDDFNGMRPIIRKRFYYWKNGCCTGWRNFNCS